MRLHCEQLARGIAGHANCHSGHIVGDVEGMFALAGLQGAVARSLRLVGVRLHVEAATIGSAGSGIFLQLLWEGVGRPGRRCGIRRCSWSCRFATGRQARDRNDQNRRGIFHGTVIVNCRQATPKTLSTEGTEPQSRVLLCHSVVYGSTPHPGSTMRLRANLRQCSSAARRLSCLRFHRRRGRAGASRQRTFRPR